MPTQRQSHSGQAARTGHPADKRSAEIELKVEELEERVAPSRRPILQ